MTLSGVFLKSTESFSGSFFGFLRQQFVPFRNLKMVLTIQRPMDLFVF
jgi:hypothetical protein